MQDTPTAGAFWEFSLSFYRSERVQAACLAMQDRCGADVNIALYLLFRASAGDVLGQAAAASLVDATQSWRDEVIAPLRELRRRMKPRPYPVDADGQERLRTVVKKAELDAEKLEQFHLETLAPAAIDCLKVAEAARRNLAAYETQLAQPLPEAVLTTLIERLEELA